MREPFEKEEQQRDIIVRQCLECLAEKGLENVSTRDFSDVTGMTASSLYYWFKNKDEIVIETTKYGLGLVVSDLLDYAAKNLMDVTLNYEIFLEFISKYSSILRVVLQVACSPQYGDRVKSYVNDISSLYSIATEKIAKNLNVTCDGLRPIVDFYVSAIVDYTIWDDEEKIKRELKTIPIMISKLERSESNKCNK